jgi:hypothetical protein
MALKGEFYTKNLTFDLKKESQIKEKILKRFIKKV